jgi:hypothetical protein
VRTTPANSQAEPTSQALARAIAAARQNPALLADAQEILLAAQADIDARNPHCRACGACCDFRTAGHRLYVTTAELALLAQDPPSRVEPLRCPYLQGHDCTARARRSLGCRVYFCQAASQSPPEDLYEIHHQAFKALHEHFDLPYFYVELTAGLTIYIDSL